MDALQTHRINRQDFTCTEGRVYKCKCSAFQQCNPPFISYILGGEELHPFGHLVGKAEQVIEGQGLRVVCLIIQVFVEFWVCK